MAINVYFFNVRHGDSIIIEIEDNPNKYLVIDSNQIKINSEYYNPAYNLLKSKKVSKIHGIIISHFHLDHYNGIEDIIGNFEIGTIFIPPVFSQNSKVFNEQITKYKEKILEIVNMSSDEYVNKPLYSFAYLLTFIHNNTDKVEEVYGRETIFRVPGVAEITGKGYLPQKK